MTLFSPRNRSQKFLLFFSSIGSRFKWRGKRQRNAKPKSGPEAVFEEIFSQVVPKPCEPVKVRVSTKPETGSHSLINAMTVDLVHPIEGHLYLPHHLIQKANESLIRYRFNSLVNDSRLVPQEFDCKRHLLWREYVYRLVVVKPHVDLNRDESLLSFLPITEQNRCHLIRCPERGGLDLNKVKEAVNLFKGRHDFGSFISEASNGSVDTSKTVDEFTFKLIDLKTCRDFDPSYDNIDVLEFVLKGKSFLRKQIRKMIGAIVSVGSHEMSLNEVNHLLGDPRSLNRKDSYITAAPDGLYLANIGYNENDFVFGKTRIIKESEDESEEEEEEEEDDDEDGSDEGVDGDEESVGETNKPLT